MQLGKAWPSAALDDEVYSRLRGLGWFAQHERWTHSLFPDGFALSEIVELKVWNKVSHFLRESWRKQQYDRLSSSNRHELFGRNLPGYSSERIRLAKEWAIFVGIYLKLAVGGMQSPYVRYVRSLGADGRDVCCPKCGTTKVRWDHI